jgi:hypothetical protein
MTTETLQQMHRTRPFVPFEINMADGRSVRISHPEQLAYDKGRMAIALTQGDSFEFIDLLLVTSISKQAAGPKNGKRRQR